MTTRRRTSTTSITRKRTGTRTTHPQAQPLSMYLSPETEAWFRQHCKDEGRTLSAAGEMAIKAWRKQMEGKPS